MSVAVEVRLLLEKRRASCSLEIDRLQATVLELQEEVEGIDRALSGLKSSGLEARVVTKPTNGELILGLLEQRSDPMTRAEIISAIRGLPGKQSKVDALGTALWRLEQDGKVIRTPNDTYSLI
jgi:hypothetical protein